MKRKEYKGEKRIEALQAMFDAMKAVAVENGNSELVFSALINLLAWLIWQASGPDERVKWALEVSGHVLARLAREEECEIPAGATRH